MTTIEQIIAWAKEPRPVKWIARETGFTAPEILTVLKVAGSPAGRERIDLSKYDAIESLVEQGASHHEIMRTVGCDNRTITRWFPNYKPFEQGNTPESQAIRQVNQDLERLDKHGNLGTRRGRT